MLIQINSTSGTEVFSFEREWQAICETVFHGYKACRGSTEKNSFQGLNSNISCPIIAAFIGRNILFEGRVAGKFTDELQLNQQILSTYSPDSILVAKQLLCSVWRFAGLLFIIANNEI
jgi:hypothetical protein